MRLFFGYILFIFYDLLFILRVDWYIRTTIIILASITNITTHTTITKYMMDIYNTII